MKRYLIVGASGTVGSSIVELLLQNNVKIRATTSKPISTKRNDGIEWVQLNLATGEGTEKAFEGVQRAFFLSPPGYADQHKILTPLIQAAKRNRLEKVVLMTAFGANAVETAPLRQAEIELEQSGVAYNILRPNWFMQNFHTFWLNDINRDGKILLPAGDAKVSFIDTRDIAAVAHSLLIHDQFKNQAFDLTGDHSYDHNEIAAILSNVSGRTLSYKNIESATLKKGLLSAGLPEDYTDFMLLIFGFLKQGYNASITSEVKKILGRNPIRFEQYAKDYRKSWVNN